MGLFNPVFAVVSREDYFKFRERATKEETKMGPIFSYLVHLQANGKGIELKDMRQRRIENKDDRLFKIYSIIAEKDFYSFVDAVSKDQLLFNEALTALAHAYANNAEFKNDNREKYCKEIESQKRDEVDYVKETKKKN
jgi:hypothetical protein